MPDKANDIVQMRFNNEGATWETVTYMWPAAVTSLGNSYDLRRVDAETGEVLESRSKTPVIEKVQQAPVAGTRANPNLEFERWWENNSANEATKESERNAFLSGWFARQNAR